MILITRSRESAARSIDLTSDEPDLPRRAERHRRRFRPAVALALVGGLALGLAASRLLTAEPGPDPSPSVDTLDLPTAPVDTAPPPPTGDPVPIEQATSPGAAVEGFLAAEARGDFVSSYAFLSAADRAAYPTPAAWVAAHAELPPITGYAVEEVRDDEVVTLLALRSTLDQVVGLIPARSRATWQAAEEDGGWRVLYGSSTTSPLYPPDDGVAAAVQQWAEARQQCSTADPLIGMPTLADSLCNAAGELLLGTPGVLPDSPQTTPLLNAYGPEVFTWARVVPIAEPVEMLAVVGPIADEWQVIGILPP